MYRRARRPSAAALLAVAVAAALSGCAGADGDSAATAPPSPKATVVLSDGAYRPDRVRVEVGDRVTFVNGSQVPNTAETDGVGFFEIDRESLDRDNLFDVHTLQPGEADSVEFDTPGNYYFHSSLNSQMTGVVEVVEPNE